ncbi:CHAT domain-containing protein [Streptomyces sp. NPDC050674]|uniref:CHAT domain-containing protein n=1 Tax=Streptomyces sp. NPDC050674 TaxID=3157216 RepID=UPI00344264AA
MSDQGFYCPRCETSVAVQDVVTFIHFPADDENIVRLLAAELNVIACEVCRVPLTLVPDLTVVWSNEKRVAILRPDGTSSDEVHGMSQLTSDGYRIDQVADLPQLRSKVYKWLRSYSNPRLKIVSDPERMSQLSRSDQIALMSPLMLRAWRAGFDGRIPLYFEGEPDERAREDTYSYVLHEHIRRIAQQMVDGNCIAELPAKLRHAVPTPCVTEGVLRDLDRFSRRPAQDPLDRESFENGFLDAVTYAYCALYGPGCDRIGDQIARYVLSAVGRFPEAPHDSLLAALLQPEIICPILPFEAFWELAEKSLRTGAGGSALFSSVADRYGLADAYSDALEGVSFAGVDAAAADRIYVGMLACLRELYPLPIAEEKLEEFGASVFFATRVVLTAAGLTRAESFIHEVIDYVGYHGAAFAVAATEAASMFLNASHPAAAQRLLYLVTDQVVIPRDDLPLSVLATVGRVMARWAGNHTQMRSEALLLLSLVRAVAHQAGAEVDAIDHTRAVLLRSEGQFEEALSLINDLVRRHPSSQRLYTLGETLRQIGQLEEAGKVFTNALDADAAPGMHTCNILVSRARTLGLRGKDDAAAQDIRRALEIATDGGHSYEVKVSSESLYLRPTKADLQEFVQKCRAVVHQTVAQPIDRSQPETPIVALVASLDDHLRCGELEQASKLIARHERIFDWPDTVLPWQLHYAAARVYGHRDDATRRRLHTRMAARLMFDVLPSGRSGVHAMSWLNDKDEFQRYLVDWTIRDIRAGLTNPESLVWAYEISNGLEISAKFGHGLPDEAALVDTITHTLGEREVIFFLDGHDELYLAHLRQDATVALLDFAAPLAAVSQAADELRAALRRANPAALQRLDDRSARWRQISTQLGILLKPVLGKRVVFLPGRTMTGLPLHLLPIGEGEMLLDAVEVSFCPNFSVLLKSSELEAGGDGATVVAVPKAGDSEEFVSRLSQAKDRIVHHLEARHREVSVLEGEAADVGSVVRAIQASQAAVMLCHGTRAGRNAGYGVCVSAAGQLPPQLLPASEIPTMERFILSWLNLNALQSSAPLVVSIACSSGQTVIGSGGVRLGLEQALLGLSTRAIISPLWDVDQEPALVWVAEFLRLMSAETMSIPAAYQAATIAVRDQYPHWYQWGAFTLTGNV